jgi:hypothetical protein
MSSFKRSQRKYVNKAYRIRNWREYEAGLCDRGNLTVWIALFRFWPRWRETLVIVKSDTVLRWHWTGFRLYWRWISKRGPGKPRIFEDKREVAVLELKRREPLSELPAQCDMGGASSFASQPIPTSPSPSPRGGRWTARG